MTKRKGPQMAHTAEEELIKEFGSLIDEAAENLTEDELAERERRANEVVENVRERVGQRERA